MTLKECYDALGGNYEDTVRRLYNEKLVEKFLFKFEEDPSFENLKKRAGGGRSGSCVSCGAYFKRCCTEHGI